jgi:O-antigen/teichoic acid export membrane protein
VIARIRPWQLRLSSLLGRAPVRRDAKSAFYNVLDYVSQPFLLLIATPIVVRHLGLEIYGIWAVVNGLAGGLAIFGLGIGDAAIKHIAACRGREDYPGAARVFEAALSLSITTAIIGGGIVFLAANVMARYAFHIEAGDHALVATAIRAGAVLLALRWIESAYSSTLKAHERYDISAWICTPIKSLAIISMVVLALYGRGAIAILLATAGWTFLGLLLLAWQVRRLDSHMSFLPVVDLGEWRKLATFGAFSSIQSIANIVFTQADRLIVGATIGPAAAGAYSICLQLVQPIQTICVQAFNFVFPRISHKTEARDHASTHHFVRNILTVSVSLTLLLSLPLLLAGKPLLSLYMGAEFAKATYSVLPVLTIAFAIVSISVVPYYALLGTGQVRFVSLLNLFAGIAAAACAAWWTPHYGPLGAAFSRLLYGCIACGSFLRLAKTFKLPLPSLLDTASSVVKP